MFNKPVYELTNVQKNILELEIINGFGTPINHIFSIFKLNGNLNEAILKKALNKIIEINDSFRIRFIKDGNNYYQYISDYEYTTIDTIYLEKEDISDVINEYQSKNISLQNLFSFSILYTPKYTYILYKSHHIISDAWSTSQVAEQTKYFYEEIEKNENTEFLPKPSYISFIEREKKYQNSDRYVKDKCFWDEYTKEISNRKLFYNSNFNKDADRYSFHLEDILFDLISNYCKKNLITEYSFFLGILSVYFSKIYNTSSIVFGTPFLNRQKKLKELETIGMFVSTLPLISNIKKSDTFISICKNIGATNLSIFRHSNFPFSKIQELYFNHSKETSSLYEIGFSYQINKQETEMKNKDIGECMWIFSKKQNNPLIIHITSLNNQKIIHYDFLTSCFSIDEVKKMNTIINHLIVQVLEGTINISELTFLTKDDIKSLQLLNDTGFIKHDSSTVPSKFNEIVTKYPDNIALCFNDISISYKELNFNINNIAQKLKDIGVTKNTPVALFFDKSIEMIASIFATLKAGGCYVPILTDEDPSRIEYILNDCSPKCILTHKNYEEIISSSKQIINVDKIQYNNTTDIDISSIDPDDTAYIIYTSGSTGNPKGTMVSHKNIIAFRNSIKKDNVFFSNEKDISISLLKYSFDASGIDIYSSLLFGGKLILVKKEDELNPEKVVKILEKEKVTRAFLIPKWIEHISIQDNLLNADLSNLRILGTGGETLKPYIIEHLLSKYSNLKVLNLYGPTETTMFTTCKEISVYEIKNNYTSIGKPIFGSRVAVVNSFLDFMPIGTKGELIIYEDDNSLNNIAKGYINLPELTKNKFIQIYHPILHKNVNAYRTGDIVKINKNLEIEFIGRDDDIVKVNGGYLVALNELEYKFRDLLGQNYNTYPIAIPYNNTQIIILFIKRKKKNISLKNIKNYINNNISFYMRPKKIIELEEFPITISGKIDRKTLKKIAIQNIEENKNTFIPPSTLLEINIYNYIKELIGSSEICINDDFIDDLGIDSLSLNALYSYLEKYNISIQDIYNHSTIRDLADFIENRKKESIEPNLSNISNIKILNNVKKFNLSNVLITGITGFLGIHIFRDLLLNPEVKNIFCIIRDKIDIKANDRLKKMIEYYFNSNNTLLDLISKKVTVLPGDITKNNLGLETNTFEQLYNKITTVINSAANVRHFDKISILREDNVKSVKNLINFCDNKKSLAHISTLSIAGFANEYTNGKIFNENTLYINQEFNNNPYLISKFEAEKAVLEATNTQGLNAIIFRIGNIMPRIEDGKFQVNANQNIFIMSLKTLIDLAIIPNEFLDINLEFSPVDECSKIIVKLLNNTSHNSIYHILNNNLITGNELKILLKFLNYNISITDLKSFMNKIENNTDEYTKSYILNSSLNKYSQEITLKEMEKNNISWNLIDYKYFLNILDIIKNL